MWTENHTKESINISGSGICTQASPAYLKRQRYARKWDAFWLVVHTLLTLLGVILTLSAFSPHAQADTGIATWYSVQSTKAEGNTGITASGERLNEASFTAALRSYQFGKRYKVTNLKNGKSIIVKHNDFGPGKKPAKRGVIIDLTPGAFDALGGKRGKNWGEFPVRVEVVK